jgi:predicted NBD/HSP70 family sugar kinase
METLKISRTANANLQNRINMSVIFNYLRENGPTYRARISRDLNISAPAVSRIVDKLIEDEYVIETEKLRIHSGKRPTQLRINSEKCYVLGIDLVKEELMIALSDFSGQIIKTCQGCKISEIISEEMDIEQTLINEIQTIITNCCSENKQEASDHNLKAICIGIPAVIDIATGFVTDAPLYSSLKDLNLKERLGEYFNVPVYVENVVKLSALGEKNYGEGMSYKDIVFVEVSNGIGAGIIIDNHLVRGTSGSAGEIGLSIINTENLGFSVSNKGYLEKNASVEAITEKAAMAIGRGLQTSISDYIEGDIDNLTPSFVCQAALENDEVARKIIQEIVEVLSIVTINIILIVNPQIIVFGGDICNLPGVNNLFIDPIKRNVARSIPLELPEIRLSSLGENAGVIGASFLAIESLLLGEFPYSIDLDLFT